MEENETIKMICQENGCVVIFKYCHVYCECTRFIRTSNELWWCWYDGLSVCGEYEDTHIGILAYCLPLDLGVATDLVVSLCERRMNRPLRILMKRYLPDNGRLTRGGGFVRCGGRGWEVGWFHGT
jgi:hypothetical protein